MQRAKIDAVYPQRELTLLPNACDLDGGSPASPAHYIVERPWGDGGPYQTQTERAPLAWTDSVAPYCCFELSRIVVQ